MLLRRLPDRRGDFKSEETDTLIPVAFRPKVRQQGGGRAHNPWLPSIISSGPTHGVRVVKLPWAEPSSRFTALFESLAIAWLKAASQKAVGEQLGLSWDEIHGIMERAVKRGLQRRQADPVRHLGVDEKAFRKGHKYLAVVNDLVSGPARPRARPTRPAAYLRFRHTSVFSLRM
jgi:hypothetical protein